MNRALRLGAVLVVVLALAAPAGADVTQQDVDSAANQLEQLRREADALVARYEDAWAKSAQLEDQVQALTELVATSQIDVGIAEHRLQERAVEMYMGGTASEMFAAILLGGGVGAGIGYLQETADADRQMVNDLTVLKEAYERQLGDLDQARRDQDVVTADMQTLATQLSDRISVAQTAYETLKAQRAEQVAAAEAARLATTTSTTPATTAPTTSTMLTTTTVAATTATTASTTTTSSPTTTTEVSTTTTSSSTTTTSSSTTTTTVPTTTTTTVPLPAGVQVCPIDGFTSFTDTFGAPRSGGRTHEGVDMMAERWTPVVAIEAGTIYQLKDGGLGGITIWLHSDSGDSYYYAHLQAWADGLYKGQVVAAGELIGYVGSSGNAPDWLPHLHFEYHPDHGDAVNPYPLVKSLCG
jgi:murein DD-endopeptidase MepM/ murein hydrolase activator NlpD